MDNVPAPIPKIQPWKAMKSMEENTNPNFSKFVATNEVAACDGSSVSKPMNRKTAHEAPVDNASQVTSSPHREHNCTVIPSLSGAIFEQSTNCTASFILGTLSMDS
ncbi:hypothetical protein CDV55_107845 [Aspergillus turcosus]|uniref:Uncharacterized protein n=1 Tax=Aspergillus turcosus TaxID=1245748 RepID=A0A229YWY4_9EURO|nr:hypothetical protein CDV55_107845 [Aspergillus turcosus]RLL93731.1 hypothetical protein CFD26_101207 [Aspergillus turcosus]